MKTKHALFIATACALMAGLPAAMAQSTTAFTFQGLLDDGGQPANGLYDLRFTLYNSLSGSSNVIAAPVINSGISISNGLFNATLDFGSGVFNGAALWLEVAARTNGAATFKSLAPRQPVTPAPFALYAESGATNSVDVLTNDSRALAMLNAANQFGGNGSAITGLNAGNITTGMLSTSRYTRTGVYRTIYVDAAAMYATPAGGAAVGTNTANGINSDVWAFSPTAANAVEFKLALPEAWNQGNITVKSYWTCTSTVTSPANNIVWTVSARDVGNGGSLGNSFGGTVTMTGGLNTGANIVSILKSSSFSVGGAPNPGDLIWFQIQGQGGNGGWTETSAPVQLLGVAIQYQENATEPPSW